MKCILMMTIGIYAHNIDSGNTSRIMWRKQILIGKFLGFIPCTNLYKKLFIVLRLCFLLCIWITTFQYLTLSRKITFTSKLLIFFQRILQATLLLSIIIFSWLKENTWILFLRELNSHITTKKYYKVLLVSHLMFIYIIIVEIYVTNILPNNDHKKFGYIIFHFNQYLRFFMIFLIQNSAKIIADKYVSINKTLEGTFLHLSKGLSKRIVRQRLYEFKILYKTYFLLIEKFNSLFGWPIYLTIGGTLLEMISDIICQLNEAQYKGVYISTCILQSFLFLVCKNFASIRFF